VITRVRAVRSHPYRAGVSIDHLAVLERLHIAFADVVSRAEALSRPVPSCPGWTVADLVVHLGTVQDSYTRVVVAGEHGVSPEPRPVTPTAGPDLLAWWRHRAAELVRVLRDTPPEAPCRCWWQPTGRGTVDEVTRRMVHETLVHLWDAQHALGSVRPCDPELAADGVEEFLERFLARPDTPVDPRRAESTARVLQLRATDLPRAWILALGDGPPRHLRDRRLRPLDAEVSGTAQQLDLLLWGRLEPERLTVTGDRALVDTFLSWRRNLE